MVTKHRLDEDQASQPGASAPTGAPASIGALITSAVEDAGTLIQHEIALAKQELKVSVRRGGIGAALLAFCAVLLLICVIIASVGVAYLIHMTGLDLAWCYLIVAGGYLVLTAILAFIAIILIKKVRGPEHAIEQAKATKAAILDRS